MKKLLLAVLILFIYTYVNQIDNPENENTIIENNQNTIYKSKASEQLVTRQDEDIKNENVITLNDKPSKSLTVDKIKKVVKPNINTSIKKENSKAEEKLESSPPVTLPNEYVAPIPNTMPQNPPEVNPDPPKEEVYTDEIYIGEIGNSGMEFNSWDEAGNWAEAQVHDKNSKYYHYSWARTTIIYYKYDSEGNVQPNSKRETYTIDFLE